MFLEDVFEASGRMRRENGAERARRKKGGDEGERR